MPEITAPDHPVQIRTTAGVSISLAAREKRKVPPYLAMAAAQQGCSVNYDDGGKGKSKSDTADGAPESQEVDPDLVDQAVRGILSEGRTDEFSPSGRPKTAAVSARLGVDVSPPDVQKSFARVTRDKRSSSG